MSTSALIRLIFVSCPRYPCFKHIGQGICFFRRLSDRGASIDEVQGIQAGQLCILSTKARVESGTGRAVVVVELLSCTAHALFAVLRNWKEQHIAEGSILREILISPCKDTISISHKKTKHMQHANILAPRSSCNKAHLRRV